MSRSDIGNGKWQLPNLVKPREFYLSLIELIDRGRELQQGILLVSIRITPAISTVSEAYYESCGLVLPAAIDALKKIFNLGELIGDTEQPGEFLIARLLFQPFNFDHLKNQLETMVKAGNATLSKQCCFDVVWSYHVEEISLITFPDRLIDGVSKSALFTVRNDKSFLVAQ